MTTIEEKAAAEKADRKRLAKFILPIFAVGVLGSALMGGNSSTSTPAPSASSTREQILVYSQGMQTALGTAARGSKQLTDCSAVGYYACKEKLADLAKTMHGVRADVTALRLHEPPCLTEGGRATADWIARYSDDLDRVLASLNAGNFAKANIDLQQTLGDLDVSSVTRAIAHSAQACKAVLENEV